MSGLPRMASILVMVVVVPCALGGCGKKGGDGSPAPTPPPDVPTSVDATSEDSAEITIGWGLVSGATSYNIYWSATSGVDKTTGTQISTPAPPYLHLGRGNGTTYYYVVTALGPGGESAESAEASAMPLDAPAGLVATPANSQVLLSWSSVTGATSYNLYWSTSSPVTKVTGTPISDVTAPHLHTNLSNGTTHYYVVTAANTVGGGAESTESQETLAVPTTITGTLDPTFNGRGWFTHGGAAGGSFDHGYGVAVDSSGRILVTGESLSTAGPPSFDMAIWCITPAGALEPTFGAQGWVVHGNAAGGNGLDVGRAIAVDASDRILVAGESSGATSGAMVIWRYNSDGSPDMTFNGQGWAVYQDAAGGGVADGGYGLAMDASGRILVSGASFNPSFNLDMVIWRCLPDGGLDTSFNAKGWVVDDNARGGAGYDYGEDITLDGSGRIVVTGYSFTDPVVRDSDMVVWRYNPDGTLDRTFNGQGWAVHDSAAGGNGLDEGKGVALDASGRILVGGRSLGATTSLDMVIWRYDSVGSLDGTFNVQGWAAFHDAAGGNLGDSGEDIALDGAGRILVAGDSNGPGMDADMAIWRCSPSGTLDPPFGTSGVATHHNAAGGDGSDFGKAMVLDASGRIVVAGYSEGPTGEEMVVWRYR